MEYIMKNFKNLLLVAALASTISLPVSARGIAFFGKSIFADVASSVSSACDSTQYNIRYALGLVSPVQEAQRALRSVGTEIKNEVVETGVEVTADVLRSYMPAWLSQRINTKQLVIAACALGIIGAFKAGSAIKTGTNKANSALGSALKSMFGKTTVLTMPSEEEEEEYSWGHLPSDDDWRR